MDDLQELTNALSNATLHSLPFPKIGGSQPHSKLQSGFQTKLLGNLHTAIYASTVGSKNVAQKNELSGGTSFVNQQQRLKALS